MKLSKRLLGVIYYLVIEGMERAKDHPQGFNEDLVELEKLLHKEYATKKYL